MRHPILIRAGLLGLLVLAPLALWSALPMLSNGQTAKSASLQKKIDLKQGQIGRKRRTEGVLTTDITKFSRRIDTLQGSISTLQNRQNAIQSDLDAKQHLLTQLQGELRRERARLARLRARLDSSRLVLSRRLTELYKADTPDLVTVVLSSHGFADLIERGDFLRRINDQDTRIITEVRLARAQSKAAAARLAQLEGRQRTITAQVAARRNEVAAVKGRLVTTQSGFAQARSQKASLLHQTRGSRRQLEEDVRALQKEQARVEGDLNSFGAPIRHGSGRLIWPVNGPITSPFCERRAWESCHPGIDIGVGSGTPIHAADAGTVRIAGPYGGYGNYTCIQHTASLSTCYAHQSQINVSIGANVRQGQVIGLSGCTGMCFGAHLHFEVRVNGSVVNPMNYL